MFMSKKLVQVAALGLALALNFSCSLFDKDKEDPSIANFSISGTGTVYFDNKAKAVVVAAQPGKTGGAITVYYGNG